MAAAEAEAEGHFRGRSRSSSRCVRFVQEQEQAAPDHAHDDDDDDFDDEVSLCGDLDHDHDHDHDAEKEKSGDDDNDKCEECGRTQRMRDNEDRWFSCAVCDNDDSDDLENPVDAVGDTAGGDTEKPGEQPGSGGGKELPRGKDEKSEPKRPGGRKRPPADDPPRADPPRAPRPRGPRPEDCECRCGDEGTGEMLHLLNNAPDWWIRCPCRQCGPRDTTGGRLDCLVEIHPAWGRCQDCRGDSHY